MASKKKPKKNKSKPKKAAPKKKPARKNLAKKKAPAKKAAKTKGAAKTTTARKKAGAPRRKPRRKSERSYPVTFERGASGSAGQSGDLQGLSRVEDVDSESVNELIEEGNAFEADVVQGVTDAGNADEEEVHTHEVPEDDVPGEYLDKD
jgi:hypothetical protein